MRWERGVLALDVRPTAATHEGAFLVMAAGPLHRPKLPGIRASRASTAIPSTPAAGLRLTRAATPDGNLTGLKDKVVASRTGATAVQCVPTSPRRQAALRFPAHALVHRRSRQPPDRSAVGAGPANPAGSSTGWTISTPWSPAASPRRLVTTAGTDIIGNLLMLMRKQSEDGKSPEDWPPDADRRLQKMEQVRARVDAWSATRPTADALKPGTTRSASAVLPRTSI